MKSPFLLLASALVVSGYAQTFPPHPTHGWVYDGAHLLSASDTATINRLSSDFNRDTGAPIVVATLPSLQSVGAQEIGIERYSTGLFNAWRIGHAQNGGNGGILLVVAKADHKVRIELGKDWRTKYDAASRNVDQSTIVPAFRSGDFSGGIVRGCQALANLSATPSAPAEGNVPPMDDVVTLPPMASTSNESGFSRPILAFVLFCLAVPLVVLVLAFRAIRRPRPSDGLGSPPVTTFGGNATSSGRTYVGAPTVYTSSTDDDAFFAGMVAGQAMSQPAYDSTPTFDPDPSSDSSSSFDSSSSVDTSSSSDSSSSFDSGSSGGGGDTGSW